MDYNLLKRQVQDFPFMLDQAITQAKQEVSECSVTTLTLPTRARCFILVIIVKEDVQTGSDLSFHSFIRALNQFFSSWFI